MSPIVKTEKLGTKPVPFSWQSDAEACQHIAARLGLPEVMQFDVDLLVTRGPDGLIRVTGQFTAQLMQICVVTLEEFDTGFTAEIDDLFDDDPKRIAARAKLWRDEAEMLAGDIPPGMDDLPEEVHNGEIDLEDLAIQHLSLALDPHPRKPGAQFSGRDDTAQEEEAPSPFAALAALKKKH